MKSQNKSNQARIKTLYKVKETQPLRHELYCPNQGMYYTALIEAWIILC